MRRREAAKPRSSDERRTILATLDPKAQSVEWRAVGQTGPTGEYFNIYKNREREHLLEKNLPAPSTAPPPSLQACPALKAARIDPRVSPRVAPVRRGGRIERKRLPSL